MCRVAMSSRFALDLWETEEGVRVLGREGTGSKENVSLSYGKDYTGRQRRATNEGWGFKKEVPRSEKISLRSCVVDICCRWISEGVLAKGGALAGQLSHVLFVGFSVR